MQKIWKDYGAITIGTILIGLATKNIFDPASMVTGGVLRYCHYWKGTLEPAFVGHQYGFKYPAVFGRF